MTLSPLFADRMHFFSELPFEDALAKFEATDTHYSSPDVEVQELNVCGPDNEVPILIYRNQDSVGPRPVIIWMHGGGFRIGSYLMNEGDVVSRELAHRGDFIVVNVEYRLVNDVVKFPAPQNDCMAVLDWVVENIGKFGGRTDAIFTGGVSAGGCLAASMAVIDRDRATHYIAGQLLNCPVLHKALPEPSAELQEKLSELVPELIFTRAFTDEINSYTLASGNLEDAEPAWWAGDVTSLEGLPPAQIINCEYDSLRASGEKYAEQLRAANIEVELITQSSVTHAHLNRLPEDCPEMVTSLNDIVTFVNKISHS